VSESVEFPTQIDMDDLLPVEEQVVFDLAFDRERRRGGGDT
jgi:hypothetical protein